MIFLVYWWLSTLTTTLVAVYILHVYSKEGFFGVFKAVASFLLLLPGVNDLVKLFTQKEIKSFLDDAIEQKNRSEAKIIPIPEQGLNEDDLENELVELKAGNKDLSKNGRLFAYVYTCEDTKFELQEKAFERFTELTTPTDTEKHTKLAKAYLKAFLHDNALNPIIFPALRKFENEVVAMTAWMLHGDSNVVGSITSGGTESILMAMKTHRDRARALRPTITVPNVVAPLTIHPAFAKAAQFLGMEMKYIPVLPSTFEADVETMEQNIDENTILLLGSAPSYPQAILDPIEDLSKLALRHHLPLHVDACFGGFMLPWVEKLGNKIPLWDFRLPGVTSISADLHKYGYATKGASVIAYRNSSIRKFQFFAHVGWPGGLFLSPTMAGTRPGGHLAAAWAVMKSMGQDGYLNLAKKIMDTTEKMKAAVNSIEGLKIFGNPLMTAFAFGCTSEKDFNVFDVADIMENKGWKLEVQRNPNSIHCSILPTHLKSADQWIEDLKEAVAHVKTHGAEGKKGISSVYGMLALAPNDGMINEFLVDLFDEIYKA